MSEFAFSVELSDLPTIKPPSISRTFATSVETVQFTFWCFTVPFYSFLLFFMVQAQLRKIEELNTPFFKLCISTAIIDLLTLFINYFGLMFPKHGFMLEFYLYLDTIYAHIYLYIAWSTGFCQAMSVSLLATNRLSAIILPSQYHKMWSGNRLWLAYAVQYIPGCLIGSLTFFNSAQLFVNDYQGVFPKFTNSKWTTIYFGIAGSFLLSNCFYLIIAYCYLFKVLQNRNKATIRSASMHSIGNFEQNQKIYAHKRRERRLFIMCSIIVMVQLSIVVFVFIKLVAFIPLTIEEFYIFYSALSDIFASINPYLLWIFSDSLRKYILQRIGIRKKVSPIRTTTQQPA